MAQKKQTKMTKQERQVYKSRLMIEMSRHIGQANKIGMGELYERVFDEKYDNRINDTRKLRKLITELRREGVPICSDPSNTEGGYYLASAGSELNAYCKKLEERALKILSQQATLKKVALPELMGQIQLSLEA